MEWLSRASMPKLRLHARPQHNKPYAGYQQSYRDGSRDLRGFLFVHGSFEGAEFRHFFLLVIVEIRVDESNHTENQEDDSENDDQAPHLSEPFLIVTALARNAYRRSPAPDSSAEMSCLVYRNLGAAGCCGCSSFLGGLGCRGGLAAALGLRRSRGRFADQFGCHDARYEKLSTMIVEIYGGAFLVGSSHDSQAVRLMLDGLTFLHHLHN